MNTLTDKNHPPVPQLQVGDRCYTFWHGVTDYAHVSTCEVRKVEVRWVEPYEGEPHWQVDYYIRTDVDIPGLKSTKMYPYTLGKDLFLTPQEVMQRNIEKFKERLVSTVTAMQKTLRAMGYTEEQTRRLLTINSKKDDTTD